MNDITVCLLVIIEMLAERATRLWWGIRSHVKRWFGIVCFEINALSFRIRSWWRWNVLTRRPPSPKRTEASSIVINSHIIGTIKSWKPEAGKYHGPIHEIQPMDYIEPNASFTLKFLSREGPVERRLRDDRG